MDRLDDLLAQMPCDPPPPGLARRIYAAVQARRRRMQRVRSVLSAALALSGLWLILPWITALLGSVAMPATGAPLLAGWWETAWSGLGGLVEAVMSGMEAFQAGLVASLQATTWIGLAALGFSALLAFDQVLPRQKKR